MTSPIINFLPYQKAWLEDQSRFKIGMFTRRGGKTFGASGEIAQDAIDAEIAKRRVRWTILSRSEATAKEAMDDALKPMIKAYYSIVEDLSRRAQPEFSVEDFHVPAHQREVIQGGNVFMIDVPEATYKAQEVRFPHGSRITAISASPDAARGFGGNMLFDEFAFHADSRRIWGSAFPVAARGGHKIRVISTTNGKGNKFYELMTSDDGTWSKHIVDIYEAVKQGLDVDIDELRAGMADEDAWAQEFELQWLDAASAWLDYDLISSCEDPDAGKRGAYRGGNCYVGVDIAARNDLFVIWVLEEVGERLITREVITRRRITFAEQDRLLDEAVEHYRVARIGMDQTGMGEKPVEDAKARYGEERVEGVLFTAGSKLDLATGFKQKFQDKGIAIPQGDPLLRSDLHAITSVTGVTGIRRLVADKDTDGHADRFWAGALAVGVAQGEEEAFGYESARGEPDRWGGASDEDNEDDQGADRFGRGGCW